KQRPGDVTRKRNGEKIAGFIRHRGLSAGGPGSPSVPQTKRGPGNLCEVRIAPPSNEAVSGGCHPPSRITIEFIRGICGIINYLSNQFSQAQQPTEYLLIAG